MNRISLLSSSFSAVMFINYVSQNFHLKISTRHSVVAIILNEFVNVSEVVNGSLGNVCDCFIFNIVCSAWANESLWCPSHSHGVHVHNVTSVCDRS